MDHSEESINESLSTFKIAQGLCVKIVTMISDEEAEPSALSGTLIGLLMGTAGVTNARHYPHPDMLQKWLELVLGVAQKTLKKDGFEVDFSILIRKKA